MKIGQIIDTEDDQNEIESKYLWYYTSKGMKRVNLLTLEIDDCWKYLDYSYIAPLIALPYNQTYGLRIDNKCEKPQSHIIIDENYNINLLEIIKDYKKCLKNYIASCYYEGSIFTFECISDSKSRSIVKSAKRFTHNMRIHLCTPPFESPTSCLGFKQKILISSDSSEQYGIWVYDITLDSYIHSISANVLKQNWPKAMIKNEGKIYLLAFYDIYATEDPLSDWIFVSYYQDSLVNFNFSLKVLYEGSIYYARENSILYEFNLANFKSKVVENLKGIRKII